MQVGLWAIRHLLDTVVLAGVVTPLDERVEQATRYNAIMVTIVLRIVQDASRTGAAADDPRLPRRRLTPATLCRCSTFSSTRSWR